MDGFAVNAEDTMGASPENPLLFEIKEDIPAGHMPQKIVGFAEAARIMTGAAIPRERTRWSPSKTRRWRKTA